MYAADLVAMIAQRTQGAWQPSPGAVYPALRSLVARRLVRSEMKDGLRQYRVTPAGSRRLTEIRAERRGFGERFAGVWRLSLDVLAPEDRAEVGLRRLRGALAMVDSLAGGEGDLLPASDRPRLREEARKELLAALTRWSPSSPERANGPSTRGRAAPTRRSAA